MKNWTYKLLGVSIFSIACFCIHKIYNFSKKTSTSIKNIRFNEKNSLHEMERIPIFEDHLINKLELSKLFINPQNGLKNEIDEEKIETILKPLIVKELQKIFFKRGWNFEALNGRIYYDIRGNNIEIQVEWRNGFFGKNSNFYDRFSINFFKK